MATEFIFQIAILIMSVVIHEVAHGVTARYYGDRTAEYEGRLTLNPLKHLDPIGSVVVPLVLFLTNAGVIFGWAKPVPYNPYNLKPGRWPEAAVAAAGPASNLAIALVFSALFRFGIAPEASAIVIAINLVLMIFNLMPIPPLDGSKLLFALFPENLYRFRNFFERYGLVLVIVFILFAWQFIQPLVSAIFRLLTGV